MLKDKVVIVTGAGSGIGRAAAQVFAAAGARVMAVDVNAGAARETAEGIRAAGGHGEAVRCDVSVEAEVAAAVAATVEAFGKLDGALNSAGVEQHNKPVHELEAEEWRRVIEVDLTGVFLCVKHQIRAMKAGGSIVNIASGAGLRGVPNCAEYVAAKHGVVGLSKTAAADAGPLGVRVNALCPGLIATPMLEERLMNDPVFMEGMADLKR